MSQVRYICQRISRIRQRASCTCSSGKDEEHRSLLPGRVGLRTCLQVSAGPRADATELAPRPITRYQPGPAESMASVQRGFSFL